MEAQFLALAAGDFCVLAARHTRAQKHAVGLGVPLLRERLAHSTPPSRRASIGDSLRVPLGLCRLDFIGARITEVCERA
jgi:hypothetical protein